MREPSVVSSFTYRISLATLLRFTILPLPTSAARSITGSSVGSVSVCDLHPFIATTAVKIRILKMLFIYQFFLTISSSPALLPDYQTLSGFGQWILVLQIPGLNLQSSLAYRGR